MGKWLALALIAGCATNAPGSDPRERAAAQTEFDNRVYPILAAQCSGNTTGCHADSYGLIVGMDLNVAYETALTYAGDYTANAPLLTAHMTGIRLTALNADATATIVAWLEAERDARGL